MPGNFFESRLQVDFARWLLDTLMDAPEVKIEFRAPLEDLIERLDEAQGEVYSGAESSTSLELKIVK